MVNAYENLDEFLGGYFHQDWVFDAISSDDVVGNYLGEWPLDGVSAARDELRGLLSTSSEDEIQRVLRKIGCYFVPASEGYASHRDWLIAVEEKLSNFLEKQPSDPPSECGR